jgi:hypothetical protein
MFRVERMSEQGTALATSVLRRPTQRHVEEERILYRSS